MLGFSNRWYPSAGKTAVWLTIGNELDDRIRVVDAPHFVATKLTAFRGRGAGDFYHHDMEDFIAVVDGRAELLDEVKSGRDDVREFVATEITTLMNDESFVEAIPGHLPGDKASQARLPLVQLRLRSIAALKV